MDMVVVAAAFQPVQLKGRGVVYIVIAATEVYSNKITAAAACRRWGKGRDKSY